MRISIICLIYKSIELADLVYESLYENTPKLKNGEAEFLFVANDPSKKLIEHLKEKKYPFVINCNEILSEEELFKQGYAFPEYIHRVYAGYNKGILISKGDIIVLINSDHVFSKDWLENLLKFIDYKTIVSSQLVEPKHSKYDVFPGAYHAEFGNNANNFNKEKFLEYVQKKKCTGVKNGGAYMPCALYKDLFFYVGLYPEGNIAGESFNNIFKTGDEACFENMKKIGVRHITSMDSIVYHMKEGELDESTDGGQSYKQEYSLKIEMPTIKTNVKNVYLNCFARQIPIVDALLGTITETDSSSKMTAKQYIACNLKKILPERIYNYIVKFYRFINFGGVN